MTSDLITKDVKTIAIVCNQWGDTGKGKFSDYFAEEWADVIARGTGGNNAGHTVVINGKKRIFHLIPAGITQEGKTNILGNGMVLDLGVLVDELDKLGDEGISYDHLMISEDAHVIMPYHIKRDQKRDMSQKDGGIGTTGKGIGPAYSDKAARIGVMVRDLYDIDFLAGKIEKAREYYPEQKINIEEIIEGIKPHAERIKPFVTDTIQEVQNFAREGKNILLEGAQGLLLSVDFGTYPYGTSSDSSVYGTAAGVGLPAGTIDMTFGIVKFPYMTRVGGGPFPTELGEGSEEYCASPGNCLRDELELYKIPHTENGNITYDHNHPDIISLINSDDDFQRGVGIRLAGEEYGATTGRPRRVGWTDLAALKYAVGINGPNIIVTKADVMQGSDVFKLGVGYDQSEMFTRDARTLRGYIPRYETFPGFQEDISQAENYSDLPVGLRESIDFLERFTGGNVRIVSTGPDRNQTLVKG